METRRKVATGAKGCRNARTFVYNIQERSCKSTPTIGGASKIEVGTVLRLERGAGPIWSMNMLSHFVATFIDIRLCSCVHSFTAVPRHHELRYGAEASRVG